MDTQTKTQTYRATVLVTRAEEWCVDAKTMEEAKALLRAGQGYRCSLGDVCYVELDQLLEM
jgi:hypothetical protein